MIVRVVKMTFQAEKVMQFQAHFDEWKPKIRSSPGCIYLELLHDVNDPRIFLTYSHWEHAADLENYRDSEVFAAVWPQVKAWFDAPAEAWSLQRERIAE